MRKAQVDQHFQSYKYCFINFISGAVVRMKRSLVTNDPPIVFQVEHPFMFVLYSSQHGNNKINMFHGSIKNLFGTNVHDEL